MAKNKKEVIEITDEGIIAVDGLVEPEDVIHIYHEPMFD